MNPNSNVKGAIQAAPIPHICVLGAGISGLRCADSLLQHSFQVTVLEARDRIGGRIHQGNVTPSGTLVDLGPNWIQGGGAKNPIIDIARRTSTATHSFELKGMVFDEYGKPLDDGPALSAKVWDLFSMAFQYSRENSSRIDPNESLLDFLTQKTEELIPDEQQRREILQASKLWGTYVGNLVEEQSLKYLWLEECIEDSEDENLFCAGTYKNILASIADPVLKCANVRLSTPAQYISMSESGVTIQSSLGSITCDAAVVTFPLGWLKKNKHIFEPPLPSVHSNAIDHIGYGCLEKVYITFKEAFWTEKNASPSQQSYTGFTQWLSPTYDPINNPKHWNVDVIELSSLPAPNSHNTLLFYIYGDQSRSLTNHLAELSPKQRNDYLVDFFKTYYSKLPNYVEGSKGCAAISCLATDWLHDEYSGNGSYSYFPVGVQQADECIRTLRKGLPERNLWFAGEHTAPFHALGTATGAYLSGEAVALKIAAKYGKK